MLLGSVGQKAEVADTHEAVGEHMEEKAADEFFGIEGHRFQPVLVSLRAKSGLDPLSDPLSFLAPRLRPVRTSYGVDTAFSCSSAKKLSENLLSSLRVSWGWGQAGVGSGVPN